MIRFPIWKTPASQSSPQLRMEQSRQQACGDLWSRKFSMRAKPGGGQAWFICRLATRRVARLATAAGGLLLLTARGLRASLLHNQRMIVRTLALAALILCLSCSGCLSLCGRIEIAMSPQQPTGVVVYPGVRAFGNPHNFEFDPFYIVDIIDLPFSIIADTFLLPWDLTHPYEGRSPEPIRRTHLGEDSTVR